VATAYPRHKPSGDRSHPCRVGPEANLSCRLYRDACEASLTDITLPWRKIRQPRFGTSTNRVASNAGSTDMRKHAADTHRKSECDTGWIRAKEIFFRPHRTQRVGRGSPTRRRDFPIRCGSFLEQCFIRPEEKTVRKLSPSTSARQSDVTKSKRTSLTAGYSIRQSTAYVGSRPSSIECTWVTSTLMRPTSWLRCSSFSLSVQEFSDYRSVAHPEIRRRVQH
jgi:hypothetical protein